MSGCGRFGVSWSSGDIQIDWPDVVRAAGDEQDTDCFWARQLLAAWRQGVLAGQRDGSDATPEGVPPQSIPVVIYERE